MPTAGGNSPVPIGMPVGYTKYPGRLAGCYRVRDGRSWLLLGQSGHAAPMTAWSPDPLRRSGRWGRLAVPAKNPHPGALLLLARWLGSCVVRSTCYGVGAEAA